MKLTRREQQVAGLIAEGLSDREIAARLGLSKWTINAYTKTLYKKLGVHRRAAVAAALNAPVQETPTTC